MENDHLGFACPRCGADLVVPASAAGAEGPCPRCGGIITAPRLVTAPKEAPVRLEVPSEKEAGPRAKPVAAFVPSPLQPSHDLPVGESRIRRKWIGATIAIAAFLVVAAALLMAVKGRRTESPRARPAASAPAAPKKPAPLLAPDAANPKVSETVNPALDPRIPPAGMDVRVMINRSAEVLGRMLGAKTLDGRLPMLETKTPREELEKSVLTGPLPVSAAFQSTEVRFNKIEDATDVAFLVTFNRDDATTEKHLLVTRTRGSQEPKVVIDPFLDGYGGRLASFAKEPTDGDRMFRTVMTVVDFCTDERVPDYATKCTAKLCSHVGGPDIAKAYYAKNSPLAEKLSKSQLVFGRSIGATVILRWSMGPKPFLEMVDVKSLDWDD